MVVEGTSSRSKPVVSGVPQGSVLGPLLFLIYINDVTNIELSPGTLLSLYADDMLLYKQINSLNDYTDLQTDINKISGWADANYLEFNTNKCKTMILTRKFKPGSFPPLQLKNVTLEQVESYKYLGVTISSSLSWSEHIHSVCMKARRLVGLLYRKFYTDVLFKLYTAMIRPHLDYVCEVWSPHLRRDIDELERVQKLALRLCAKQWDINYENLLYNFNLPSLADRRHYPRLCVMYKIINELVHFPNHVFIPVNSSVLRSSSRPLFHQPFAHTNFFHELICASHLF